LGTLDRCKVVEYVQILFKSKNASYICRKRVYVLQVLTCMAPYGNRALQSHAVLKACKKALSDVWREQSMDRRGTNAIKKLYEYTKYKNACKIAIATTAGKNVWCALI